ncbi:MAG: outer membrane protein assembly factor BamD [Bacteroidales bacterium]|nr:outer membrane protein assembly factor BamD [Bacteroidales bacterium]
MFGRPFICSIIIIFSVTLASCSKYQKLLKSPDSDLKYEKANQYFEQEDYYRAMNLYEQLIPVYRGTEKAEIIYYNYAYAYFHQRDYVLASYYFQKFYKTFPRSSQVEECYFMSAYCKFLESPNYSLDQTTTREAINELQLFLNVFPASDRAAECNRLIDELRAKLERKDYEISRLYLKMEKHEAAVTSFRNLLKNFPDTQYKEQALYSIGKAYFEYAENSVWIKKKERYQQALRASQDFMELYPDSRYIREIKSMADESQRFLADN